LVRVSGLLSPNLCCRVGCVRMPGPAGQTSSGKDDPDQWVHKPKNDEDIEKRHKVIRFGELYETGNEDEDKQYNYLHQRADLRISKGAIPINFLSYLPLAEGHDLYLETRPGGVDEDGKPVGPVYQVSWKCEREVLGAGEGDGWNPDFDDLWTAVLAYFERKNLLSEDTLRYLDADPFVLFGIDDPVTQQALQKLGRYPCLMCQADVPTFDEWAAYLKVDPLDLDMKWLVQAFSESELPKPWTCYKGVGSIVCYIHSDSGEVTWKHPFYDFFRQLREFCTEAIADGRFDEIKKVRCTRLMWTYEATRVQTDHEQEPLISPEYLTRMADIFGYDIKVDGCIVRNLKAQLKIFARSYRETQEVDLASVVACAEILHRDVEKYREMTDHWTNQVNQETQFDLNALAAGELQCVNCGTIALCFCLECKDYLCLSCYDSLHVKGSRKDHAPFRLVPCTLCINKPAKLQCTFTDKSLCHQCYAMDHIKQLPPDGKENQPKRIDYLLQYERYAQFARERNAMGKLAIEAGGESLQANDYESVLSIDWHPFYDARGVKFYHNFVTGERMRQSPVEVPNTADPGAVPELAMNEAADDSSIRTESQVVAPEGSRPPLLLTGFDALETSPKARKAAAEQPDFRNLRPPHRVHQPCETHPL